MHHETSLSPSPAVPHSPRPSLPIPGRPPPSPAVLTLTLPSPTVPGHPHSSPAVPHSPRPSSPFPSRPPPSPTVPHSPYLLPCTNMSHPVGPAVLPKDGRPPLRAPRTDYSQPSRTPANTAFGTQTRPRVGGEHAVRTNTFHRSSLYFTHGMHSPCRGRRANLQSAHSSDITKSRGGTVPDSTPVQSFHSSKVPPRKLLLPQLFRWIPANVSTGNNLV